MFEEFYSGLEPTVLLSIDFANHIKIGKETYHVLGFSKDSMGYETLEETAENTIKELRGLYETLSFWQMKSLLNKNFETGKASLDKKVINKN